MFEREAINWLRKWRDSSLRKPLVIRGARQVGKTSLVKAFGAEFDQFLSFNLDEADDLKLFQREIDVNDLYISMLALRHKTKSNGSTLIFIDEIQNSPIAIKMLRYFYEKLPNIYVIAAGSLLESMLQQNKQVSFPVGRVEYMVLHPCSFCEFLTALGEVPLRDMVKNANVPAPLHDRVSSLFNKYTLIGGMPQVVDEYAKTGDVVALDSIYQSLLTGYQDDVEKYCKTETSRNVIRYVITKGWPYACERIAFEHFAASNYKSREMGEAIRTLQKTMLLELVYPTVETNLPITPDTKKQPKLMWIDTGLVNYAAGVQSELFGKEDINDAWRGRIAEHIVGQEILSISNRFLDGRSFWVREKRNSQAELDFLYNDRFFGLLPVEVKSGANAHLRSLNMFMLESLCTIAVRFWNKPLRKDEVIAVGRDPKGNVTKTKPYTLYSLPYYYAGQIDTFIKNNCKKGN